MSNAPTAVFFFIFVMYFDPNAMFIKRLHSLSYSPPYSPTFLLLYHLGDYSVLVRKFPYPTIMSFSYRYCIFTINRFRWKNSAEKSSVVKIAYLFHCRICLRMRCGSDAFLLGALHRIQLFLIKHEPLNANASQDKK